MIRSSIMSKLTITIVTIFIVLFTLYMAFSSWMTWQSTKASQEDSLMKATELSALEINETFLDTFRMLETESAAISSQYAQGTLTGEYILNLKRQLLADNEFLLSNSSIFEPGYVTVTANDAKALIDASGRFVPYLIRDGSNPFVEVPIEDYLEAEWYTEPIKNGQTLITDPYDYEVNGETLSMVTLVVPVKTGDQVFGYVSADFSLSFLNTLVTNNAPNDGVQRVVTGNSLIVADSFSSATVGQTLEQFTSESTAIMNAIQANELYSAYQQDLGLEKEVYQMMRPISFPNVEKSWAVASAIPVETMFAPLRASLINSIISAIVIAGVLAIAVYFTVRYLLKPLIPLREALAKAAAGDLTANLHEEGLVNDEIGSVSKAYNHMISKTRDAVSGVLISSDNIQQQTTTAFSSITNVHAGLENSNEALAEIAQGSQHQSEEMEQSVHEATALSEKIDGIQKVSSLMRNQVTQAMGDYSAGINQISELKTQQAHTNKVNAQLTAQMQQLLKYVEDINRVMDTIKGISEQTNLLALNASIEAARAGEAGMGFAVVAQQVRHLAEQSHEETSSIQETINAIRQASNETALFVNESSQLIEQQSVVIEQTEQVFINQVTRSEELEQQLLHLVQDLHEMTEQKNKMLNSMHMIASISEQSAAATQEVAGTASVQLTDVDTIKGTLAQLEDISAELTEMMQVFKVQ